VWHYLGVERNNNPGDMMTVDSYIEELAGERINSEDINMIGLDSSAALDRSNWYTQEQGEEALYTGPISSQSGSLWALIDDGGRDGARWFPVCEVPEVSA